MDNTILIGAWAGFIGVLFGDSLVNKVSYYLFHTSTTAHYLASLIFHKQAFNDFEFIIGFIAHLCTGAIIGVIIALLIRNYGKERPYVLGLGVSTTMWIVHVVIIPNIINYPHPYILRTPPEAVVDLISNIIYGTLTTYVYLKKSLKNT